MEKVNFKKILLKTAFCCMVSDGNIDKREIDVIKSLCEASEFFVNFDYESEINFLIEELNKNFKVFLIDFFTELENSAFNEQEELSLIDFSVKTINSDEKIDYSEIKFFKNIRQCLEIPNNKILENYPDIEDWLEEDIKGESIIEKIKGQYLESFVLPEFKKIDLTSDE